jgi:predicted nucleotidyltransferase component of viral defense system
MIREWLQEYAPKNKEEADEALREIMQEIALAGLQRSGFFERAAFYGGTCLRILHGLDRFSEDLDFSLLKEDASFSLKPYEEGIVNEFKAFGMEVTVKKKIKTKDSNVESAFLKSETIWKELELQEIIPQEHMGSLPHLKIKLEVDTKPPGGFTTEEKLLMKPFSFYVKSFSLPDLFAGKMHALLFRKWKSRVKGRDWYDLEWYIKKNVPLHLDHLAIRAMDSGDWKGDLMTKEDFLNLFYTKVKAVSFSQIKEDARKFIKNGSVMDIWSEKYFQDLVGHLRFL